MSKKTLAVAIETGNDVIIQVKANQSTLLADCERIAATEPPDEQYQEPLTKTRNRLEARRVSLFFYPHLTQLREWGWVKGVVRVERERRVFDTKRHVWRTSHETAYYISTIALSAQEFCQVIRQHWGIENSNHYVRDVTLGEDKSRTRINPHIFARLRSFALNILRKNHVPNVSLALFDNCMNLNRVLAYAGVLEN